MDGSDSDSAPVVVVTGFGPFATYKVNSSWESVKRLKLIPNDIDVKLIVEQIVVAYEDVNKRVEQIWSEYKPSLVVHCGVSSLAKCITLETRAVRHKHLYLKPDIFGRTPDCKPKHASCADNCEHCLDCRINLQNVCQRVNDHFSRGRIKMGAQLSSNAGRYLCEYIFQSSLRRNSERTAFIHVPDMSDNCPIEDIASALQLTIEALIEEVLSPKESNNVL